MSVQTFIENKTGYIIFSHPPVNALPMSELKELEKAFNEISASEKVKIIVLKSEGKTFCAGASFDELLQLNEREKAKDFFNGFGSVILQMRSAPQPVVVLVQGKAVGGALGLIAAADLVVSVEEASFKLSELSIGIGPYVIAPPIIRKTGISFFQEMSMQPWKWFSAFDLRKAGLIHYVVENKSRMNEILEIIINSYENYDKQAVAAIKKEIWKDTADWDQVFEKQAAKSAGLLLKDSTKEILKNLRSKK